MRKYIILIALLGCCFGAFAQKVNTASKPVLMNVGKELLPNLLNLTEADEFNPQFNSTGNLLYFNRSLYDYNVGGRKDMQDIYICELDTNGVIYQVYNAGEPLNNLGANAVIGTAGTSLIYLNNTYSESGLASGLSYAVRKEDGNFSFPKTAGLKLPVKRGFVGMCLSYDKSALVVSMLEEDQRGRKSNSNSSDLFIYTRNTDEGGWNKPVAIEGINSTASEISPWLTPDGKVLFFASSKNKGGQGGYDIYYSKRLDSTKWTEWSAPVNLGKKVNTKGFDAYFIIDPFNRYGYFSSDNGKKEGLSDIYRISLKELFSDIPNPGIAIDSNALRFITRSTMLIRDTIYVTDTVQVLKYAPVDTTDYLRVATDKFYNSKDSLVRLSKVYFNFNEYLIRPDQMDSLNTALELAMADEGIILFIRGYTDVIGSDEYNQKLSEKRSLAIKQVLVAKGFPEKRIYAIGQGKDAKNLATAEDEDGRKKNRRADLEIRRGKIVDNEFVETGE